MTSEIKWKAYRFTYEWDFLYRDRGFLGMLVETKYTDVNASLTASFAGISDTEFTHAQAPLPSIGIIGRVYPAPNISITGEFSGFRYHSDAVLQAQDYGGKYYDFDLYGTVNFTDHIGAQAGYRSFDVFYKVKQDNGTMNAPRPLLRSGREVLRAPPIGGVSSWSWPSPAASSSSRAQPSSTRTQRSSTPS